MAKKKRNPGITSVTHRDLFYQITLISPCSLMGITIHFFIGDVNTGIQYNDGHITLVVTPEQVKG